MSLNSENPATVLLHRVRDGVILLDSSLNCVYANHSAVDLLPRLVDAPDDASIWDIFPEDADGSLARALAQVRAEGRPVEVPVTHSLGGRSLAIRIYPEADGGVSLYLQKPGPVAETDGRLLPGEMTRSGEMAVEEAAKVVAARTSEARYHTIFEQTPISLWEEDYSQARRRLLEILDSGVTDLRAYLAEHPEVVDECLETVRILAVNETSVALYEAADKDELIQGAFNILPPDTRQELQEFFVHLALGDEYPDQEMVDLTLRGAKRYLLRRPVPLPSVDPDECRFLIALSDTTARRLQEEELRRQAALLDEINDAVILTDMQTKIQGWNRAAEEVYGWRAEEVIGKRVGEILHTRFASDGAEEAAALLMVHGRWNAEVEQQRKDGSRISVSASVSLLTDVEGNPSGMVAVNRDITELVRGRNALRDAEQRYRHLFDAAPLMYLEFETSEHPSGKKRPIVRDVNQAYLDATGFSRDEVVGRDFLEKLGAESRQIASECFQSVLAGAIVEGERVLLTKDGGHLVTLLRTVPQLDEDGNVVATLAMYLDISNRKRARQQQRAEAERTRTLLHIASRLNRRLTFQELAQTICHEVSAALRVPAVSLSLVNADGSHFLHAADVGFPAGSGATLKAFPVPAGLKGDLPPEELTRINPIDSLTTSQNYPLYQEMGLVLGVNVFLVRDTRILGSLNLAITDPERGFDENDLALLRGVADVATQAILNAQLLEDTMGYAHRLEDQVRQRTAELETALFHAQEADRIKSQFVTDMNHELRTPLTNITLYLDILAFGGPDKRDRALEVVRQETTHLSQLIEDVLDISRIDLHRLHVEPESVHLNSLVEGLLADRAALLESSPVQVHFTPDNSLSPVQADPKLIGRVLTNLLDNAINYAGDGDVRIRVRREETESRRWQVLSVADSGPGIAQGDLPHIFECFYRGQAARDTRAAGTGLGLSVSQEIVELHGGYITVDSKSGAGATFSIWLPDHTSQPSRGYARSIFTTQPDDASQ